MQYTEQRDARLRRMKWLATGLLFLAGAMVLVGLSFVVLGVETHGVPMALDSDEEMVRAGDADTALSPVPAQRR